MTKPSFLSKYIDARFAGEITVPAQKHKDMVVTISRDAGCDGVSIVEETVKELNARLKGSDLKHPWRYVSKEILEESAMKINLKPDVFEKLEHIKDKNFVENIIDSFSTENYPTDVKIKKTYKEVIESVAKVGRVIILGRAGVAIVKHTKRNLHVKLAAPLDWRINKIEKKYNISKEKATKHILESDNKRAALKKYYMHRKLHYTDYDIVLNVSSLTKKEICSALVSLILEKGYK